MKREILYRGKRLDTKEWVYGSLIDSGNHSQVAIFPYNDSSSTMSVRQLVYLGMVSVDPNTVGQFTGMTDKNGKRIFEDDIIHVMNYDYDKDWVVKFENAKFYADNITIPCVEDLEYLVKGFDGTVVIDNKFDNPELLEVKS